MRMMRNWNVRADAEGDYVCPRQKNRPVVNVEICKGRQGRRHRGCVTCRIPQRIERGK